MMDRLLAIVLFCVVAQSAAAQSRTVLIADRLIDAVSDEVRTGVAVVVEGERIVHVGEFDGSTGDARIIELPDLTLLPGMIDGHVHPLIFGDDYQENHIAASSAYKALLGLAALQRLLFAGWTSVRVPGDADVFYANQDIRRAIEEGVFAGPRLTGAGHYISITGGGGDNNYKSVEQTIVPDGLIADGVDELRKAVRREIKFGSDWIKVLVSGAYHSVGDNPRNVHFSPEELQVVVDEANRRSVPVAAHAHATEAINMAVRAGVRSIEHGSFMDEESMRLMVEHGTYLVPTLYVGDYYAEPGNELRAAEEQSDYEKNYRDKFFRLVGMAHRMGVKIVVGSDLGGYFFPPDASALEFATLVEAGMTPMEAIQAGTRVAAEMLMRDDRLGTLEAGKLADVIAVAGDPSQDIRALQNVRFVMIGGRVVRLPGHEGKTAGELAGLLPAVPSGSD